MNAEHRTWPELVGKDGRETVAQIKRETGLTQVQLIEPNSMVTMDYRTDRVRVHVDEQGKVASTPSTG